jgi:uncharacterized protein (TIGR03118 family)
MPVCCAGIRDNTLWSKHMQLQRRRFLLAGTSAMLTVGCGGGVDAERAPILLKNAYKQINLAANHPRYNAKFTFGDMVNAWGISIRPRGAGGHFWVTAGGKSFQFVGDVTRSADPKLRSLFQDDLAEVTIPGADALEGDTSTGKATGTVFNGADLNGSNFRVSTQTAVQGGAVVQFDGSARFIFSTDSGAISAWTDRAQDGSVVRVNGPTVEMFNGSDQGMAFFGLAINPKTWDVLWAVDFGEAPQIRQFDKNWQLVPTVGFANPFATGALVDAADASKGKMPRPGDPVPFNMQVLGERVFVAYCVSQPLKDEQGNVLDINKFLSGEEDALDKDQEVAANAKPGKGKVVEFDLSGKLVRVFEDDGRLNAPWGVALAPDNFGKLSGALLVSNFGGAGKIAAFDPQTGKFIDYLRDAQQAAIGIAGLWALQFGNGESLGDANALYFAAGPEDEKDGLFGALRYAE